MDTSSPEDAPRVVASNQMNDAMLHVHVIPCAELRQCPLELALSRQADIESLLA